MSIKMMVWWRQSAQCHCWLRHFQFLFHLFVLPEKEALAKAAASTSLQMMTLGSSRVRPEKPCRKHPIALLRRSQHSGMLML